MSEFRLHPRLAQDTVVLGDLDLSRVLLSKDSRYPWLILVPKQADISEIHHLSEQDQLALMRESSAVSSLMEACVSPDKMNVASLGNMVPQLHLHHVARFKEDDAWPGPIWGAHPALLYSSENLVKAAEIWRERLSALAQFAPASPDE